MITVESNGMSCHRPVGHTSFVPGVRNASGVNLPSTVFTASIDKQIPVVIVAERSAENSKNAVQFDNFVESISHVKL